MAVPAEPRRFARVTPDLDNRGSKGSPPQNSLSDGTAQSVRRIECFPSGGGTGIDTGDEGTDKRRTNVNPIKGRTWVRVQYPLQVAGEPIANVFRSRPRISPSVGLWTCHVPRGGMPSLTGCSAHDDGGGSRRGLGG